MLIAVWSYIENMLPFLIIALPVLILWRFLSAAVVSEKNKISIRSCINPAREIAFIIFGLYLAGLGSQTVIPKMLWENGRFVLVETRNYTRFNIIPFRTIIDYFVNIFSKHNMYHVIFFLGNILMFVPIGFFCMLLFEWRKKPCLNSAAVAFAISLFIETVQIFLNRMVDIDDVILNTLGGYLGCLIYMLIKKVFPSFTDKFKRKT